MKILCVAERSLLHESRSYIDISEVYAIYQKKVANTTKVEYEFREKSVIFRAGRVLDNFFELLNTFLISMVSV
jgi:hypothetical protein